MAGGGIGSQPQTSKGGMLCHSPASLLEGGGGTGAGGVLGIQPHYDLLFLPRPIGAYPVAAHKRLVRQPLFRILAREWGTMLRCSPQPFALRVVQSLACL